MKIYEKPMAIVNKFEVEDVIASSVYTTDSKIYQDVIANTSYEDTKAQGVVFQW
jgi:hypothetical protein